MPRRLQPLCGHEGIALLREERPIVSICRVYQGGADEDRIRLPRHGTLGRPIMLGSAISADRSILPEVLACARMTGN
ncbi:hypothetical protein CXZ10_17315 [Pleomorphomonas diazotrophica]|uniref:Uncharacterized protein n=1 Tax=Pleomorphomonas diazotrophica TaxID=1166257 RepID=A0A2N3LTD2_9HYPH|nr:hypothetical protein CXZ10_17315 [Pleomorphomonas diazotrophica]